MTCTPSELRSAFAAVHAEKQQARELGPSLKESEHLDLLLSESGVKDFMTNATQRAMIVSLLGNPEQTLLCTLMIAFEYGFECGERIALAHSMERMLRTMEEGLKP